MRLRQIAFVAEDLKATTEELCDVLGLEVAYRDPGVGKWGLENIVAPIGGAFLEIVAPKEEGTSAGRYLERRGGDGGYMVILDTDDIAPWRTHLAEISVRIAADLAHGAYAGLQLHPRDTGGALLEINTTRGNGPDPYGP
jgi:hypothetical protein